MICNGGVIWFLWDSLWGAPHQLAGVISVLQIMLNNSSSPPPACWWWWCHCIPVIGPGLQASWGNAKQQQQPRRLEKSCFLPWQPMVPWKVSIRYTILLELETHRCQHVGWFWKPAFPNCSKSQHTPPEYPTAQVLWGPQYIYIYIYTYIHI